MPVFISYNPYFGLPVLSMGCLGHATLDIFYQRSLLLTELYNWNVLSLS